MHTREARRNFCNLLYFYCRIVLRSSNYKDYFIRDESIFKIIKRNVTENCLKCQITAEYRIIVFQVFSGNPYRRITA